MSAKPEEALIVVEDQREPFHTLPGKITQNINSLSERDFKDFGRTDSNDNSSLLAAQHNRSRKHRDLSKSLERK